MVETLPAMQEVQVPSLGQENALEEELVTHSSILAWRIPRTEEPDGGCKESDMIERLTLSLFIALEQRTTHELVQTTPDRKEVMLKREISQH